MRLFNKVGAPSSRRGRLRVVRECDRACARGCISKKFRPLRRVRNVRPLRSSRPEQTLARKSAPFAVPLCFFNESLAPIPRHSLTYKRTRRKRTFFPIYSFLFLYRVLCKPAPLSVTESAVLSFPQTPERPIGKYEYPLW